MLIYENTDHDLETGVPGTSGALSAKRAQNPRVLDGGHQLFILGELSRIANRLRWSVISCPTQRTDSRT